MKQAFTIIFRYILNLLYQLACKWIKEEDTVIIAGHGAKYLVGNNAYLFHYLEDIRPSFDYFFYTKNKTIFRSLRNEHPGKILYAYSLKTFIIFLKARVLIVSTGPEDFFPYFLQSRKKIINIWHGTPIKNIGFLISEANPKMLTKFSRAIDFFCVSSEFEGDIIKKAFHLSPKKILLSGQPKNDFIFQNHSCFLKSFPFLQKKVILYAPTFRETGMKQRMLKELIPLQQLQKMLEKQDAYFLYRNHINTTEQQSIEGFSRIISASPTIFSDSQPLLYFTDLLITDYSGIYFDFLLLNRPIIFYNWDYEAYQNKRNFLYSYNENTPGPKIQTPELLFNTMEEYLQQPEKDAAWREKIKNKFHTFTDGKACERIYGKITEML